MVGEKVGAAAKGSVSFLDDNQVDTAVRGDVAADQIAGQDDLLDAQLGQELGNAVQFPVEHLLAELGKADAYGH